MVRLRLVSEGDTNSEPVDGEQLSLFPQLARRTFLGLLDLAGISDERFVQLLRKYRPEVVIDTRAAPFLNIGRLHRKDVLSLLRKNGAQYTHSGRGASDDERVASLHCLLEGWGSEKHTGIVLVFVTKGEAVDRFRGHLASRLLELGLELPEIRFLEASEVTSAR